MGDQRRIARIVEASGQPLRNAEPALDLAQHQHPASDDSEPPSKQAFTDRPATGDRPGSGNVGSSMAGAAFREADRIGFSTQILSSPSALGYTRHPTTNYPGSEADIRTPRGANGFHMIAKPRPRKNFALDQPSTWRVFSR